MVDEGHAEWAKNEKDRKEAKRKAHKDTKSTPELPDGGKRWKARRGETDEESDEGYSKRYQ